MCWSCHQRISDEVVIQQLKDSLENPTYEVWNKTSISHLFISLTGCNGYEASEITYKIFQGYINWIIENNYSSKEVIQDFRNKIDQITDLVKTQKENGLSNEELKEIAHSVIESL